MAFFDFFKKLKKKRELPKDEAFDIEDFLEELGIAREGVIGTYNEEENPDDLGPETYIQMQKNDGEIQAIVRLFTLPIISTPFHFIPAKNDSGEKDFIETIFTAPPKLGGMTTPLPFLIADMTRAVFEGFRLYEKVARIIPEGKYKGFVGWKKLAPRDARTLRLKADEHGGFAGARQTVFFGKKYVTADIPPEKCLLFTFQKEKHWLYGESILKTAFFHYEKKHKLYYIAHKKAELETLGYKILRLSNLVTPSQREKAEKAVEQLGLGARISLPPGIDLEIQKGGGGYDPLPLIEHHNLMMAKSALCQAVDQVKYAYPYGKGTPSSQFLILAIESVMSQMAETINNYAIAPLIDWNFKTSAYPKLRFERISDPSREFLKTVVDRIMKAKISLPEGFVAAVIEEAAKNLNLDWHLKETPESQFERGKIKAANELKIKAPSTPERIKEKLKKVNPTAENLEKCFQLGKEFVQIWRKQNQK